MCIYVKDFLIVNMINLDFPKHEGVEDVWPGTHLAFL